MALTEVGPRYARQPISVVTTPLSERPHHTASPRRRRTRHPRRSLTRKLISALICCVAFFYVWLSRFDDASHATGARRIQSSSNSSSGKSAAIQAGTVDSVVRYLTKLAEKRPSELWHLFRMDSESTSDPFLLSLLESGSCPWSTSTRIDWMPPRPPHSADLSSKFQSLQSTSDKQRPRKQKMRRNKSSNSPPVILWYEHISKAGGTTFCALANSNMPELSVPRYHCMPHKGQLMDGRVGSWSNEELVEFVNSNNYRIVANEWDPFDLAKLKLSGRDLYSTNSADNNNDLPSPNLLFVTTLRDPADRLLSSYQFFSKYDEQELTDKNNFGKWIKRTLGRVQNYKVGTRSAFSSNIARNNYMVWRFSGGHFPATNKDQDESFFSSESSLFPSSITSKSIWKEPFQTAIRSLSQHDLILPMDVLSQPSGKQALEQLLGWTQFSISGQGVKGEKEKGHVVTIGQLRNSNAKSYLNLKEYQALWERNWLDYILWYWARAVFFARLYCNVE